MRIFAVTVLLVGLSACADSGPMKIGKDTYTISVRVPFSGPAGAKGEALQEANQYCGAQQKQVLLQGENSHECALHGGCGEAEITFLCLDENDPRYLVEHQLRKDNGVTTLKVQ